MRLLPSQIPLILDILEGLLREKKLKCISCGSPLPAFLTVYRWREQYLWGFIYCSKCGYQNALWKIFKRTGIPMRKER